MKPILFNTEMVKAILEERLPQGELPNGNVEKNLLITIYPNVLLINTEMMLIVYIRK